MDKFLQNTLLMNIILQFLFFTCAVLGGMDAQTCLKHWAIVAIACIFYDYNRRQLKDLT